MVKKVNNEIAIKSVKNISLFTSISRVLGYFRSLAIAIAFGTGMIADAFFIAFRLPNTLRKLLGEGAINAAVIPIFSSLLVNNDKKEAFRFANKLFSCVFIIVGILTLFTYITAPWIIHITAPGFALYKEKLVIATFLLRFLFPYIIFISLSSIAMGILNSFKHFNIPAFAPILFNITFISSLLFIAPQLENPIWAIIIGVLIGGACQLAIHIFALKKFDFKFSFDPDFKHPLVKKTGQLIIPSIFSLAITEINIFVNNIIASYESISGVGAISALFYANFLVQLPLAIFATSVSTAFFPEMADYAAKKDLSALNKTFINAMRLSFFIILPACIGLITLAHPITRLLYQYGKFTDFSTQQTASALIAYSIGLAAFAGVKIIVPVFYSLEDTKTPVKIGGISVLCNLILSIIFSFLWKHVGLALAASVSAFLNFGLLFYYLEKKIKILDKKLFFNSLGKILLITALMGIAVKIVFNFLNLYLFQAHVLSKILLVGGSILAGLITYFTMAYILKNEELTWLIKSVKKNPSY